MSTQSSEEILKDIIDEKIDNKEMFTAFDITLNAKKRGMKDRHRFVRALIHRLASNATKNDANEYEISNINIGSDKGIAKLYHPSGSDIVNYFNKSDSKAPTRSGSVTTSVVRSVPSPVQTAKYDHVGRFSIKSTLVKSAGFKCGQLVRVNIESGRITIRNSDSSTLGPIYVVNTSNGIRLAKKRIIDAFDQLPPNIQVQVGDELLVLTE